MSDTRAIRVFVSSTFRDMQDEREELVKRIFPSIRRLCEQRGVAFSEVDLRWGVTDEQKAEGAVLPICLAEIDRSRPYFIGLIGQRYGWVPESLPDDLAAQLPVAARSRRHVGDRDRDPPRRAQRPDGDRLGVLLPPRSGMDGNRVDRATRAARRASERRRHRRCSAPRPPSVSPRPTASAARRAASTDLRERCAGLRLRRRPRARRAGACRPGGARRSAVPGVGRARRRWPAKPSAHDAYSAAQVRGTVRRPALEARLDAWAGGAPAPLTLSGAARRRNDRDRRGVARPVARHASRRCRDPPPRPRHRRRRAVGADGEPADRRAVPSPRLR